jgi:molecular chaperone DnaK
MYATDITPSLVGLNEHVHELKVGNSAEKLSGSTISDIKRKLGEASTVRLGEKDYSPEEIASMIFKYLKDYGEDYLTDEIKDAVISVPAFYNERAKQATINAAEMAGLQVLRIIPEPVAAALAYGYDKDWRNRNILVYDLGGGTFSISVVCFLKSSVNLIAFEEVKYLGGEIFDQRIIRFLKEHLSDVHGLEELNDEIELKLRNEARKAKESLSNVDVECAKINFIVIANNKIVTVKVDITREMLSQLTDDLINETFMVMDSFFNSGKVSKSEINDIVLAGGTTRMPVIHERIKEYFGIPPLTDVDPELAVSFGSAIVAGYIKGDFSSVSWI